MKKTIYVSCVVLFILQSAVANDKRTVRHHHNGKYHQHVLPNNGIGGHNHQSRKSKSNNRQSVSPRRQKQKPVRHPHTGTYHTHVLPNNGVGPHFHNKQGARASNPNKRASPRKPAPIISSALKCSPFQAKIPVEKTGLKEAVRIASASEIRKEISGHYRRLTNYGGDINYYYEADGTYWMQKAVGSGRLNDNLVRKGRWTTSNGRLCVVVQDGLKLRQFHYNLGISAELKMNLDAVNVWRPVLFKFKDNGEFENKSRFRINKWLPYQTDWYKRGHSIQPDTRGEFKKDYYKQWDRRKAHDENLNKDNLERIAKKADRNIDKGAYGPDLKWYNHTIERDDETKTCKVAVPLRLLRDKRIFKHPIPVEYLDSITVYRDNTECLDGYLQSIDNGHIYIALHINSQFKRDHSWGKGCDVSGCDEYLRSPILIDLDGLMVDGVFEGEIEIWARNKRFINKINTIHVGKNAEDQFFSDDFFSKDKKVYSSRGNLFPDHASYVSKGMTTKNPLEKNLLVQAGVENAEYKTVARGGVGIGGVRLVDKYEKTTSDLYSTLKISPKNPELFRGKRISVTISYKLELEYKTWSTNLKVIGIRVPPTTESKPVGKEYTFILDKSNNWSASSRDLLIKGKKDADSAKIIGFKVHSIFNGISKNEIYVKRIREL